jgi:hypothetical protein
MICLCNLFVPAVPKNGLRAVLIAAKMRYQIIGKQIADRNNSIVHGNAAGIVVS